MKNIYDNNKSLIENIKSGNGIGIIGNHACLREPKKEVKIQKKKNIGDGYQPQENSAKLNPPTVQPEKPKTTITVEVSFKNWG